MRGKSKRDSPVLVLLAPPSEYDWMIRQIPVEKMVAMTVQSKVNNSKSPSKLLFQILSLPSTYR